MNRKEEDQRNGNGTVQDQNPGNVVQNHAEEAGGKGNQDQSQQKPALCAQLLSVSNSVDD